MLGSLRREGGSAMPQQVVLSSRLSPEECLRRIQEGSGTWSEPAGKPVRAAIYGDQVQLTATRALGSRVPLRLRLTSDGGGGTRIEGRLGQGQAALIVVGVVMLMGFGAAASFVGFRNAQALVAPLAILGLTFIGFLFVGRRVITVHREILDYVRGLVDATEGQRALVA